MAKVCCVLNETWPNSMEFSANHSFYIIFIYFWFILFDLNYGCVLPRADLKPSGLSETGQFKDEVCCCLWTYLEFMSWTAAEFAADLLNLLNVHPLLHPQALHPLLHPQASHDGSVSEAKAQLLRPQAGSDLPIKSFFSCIKWMSVREAMEIGWSPLEPQKCAPEALIGTKFISVKTPRVSV